MKKRTTGKAIVFSFIALLFFAILSCQKDNGSDTPPPITDTYYVRAKIDGKEVNFTTAVAAMDTFISPRFDLFIQGWNEARTAHLSLDMATLDEATKQGDTFQYDLSDSVGMQGIIYNMNALDPQYNSVWMTYPAGKYTGSELKINILEMNSEFVRGTFSGRIFPKMESATYKLVTDGSFKAKF